MPNQREVDEAFQDLRDLNFYSCSACEANQSEIARVLPVIEGEVRRLSGELEAARAGLVNTEYHWRKQWEIQSSRAERAESDLAQCREHDSATVDRAEGLVSALAASEAKVKALEEERDKEHRHALNWQGKANGMIERVQSLESRLSSMLAGPEEANVAKALVVLDDPGWRAMYNEIAWLVDGYKAERARRLEAEKERDEWRKWRQDRICPLGHVRSSMFKSEPCDECRNISEFKARAEAAETRAKELEDRLPHYHNEKQCGVIW